MGSSVSKRREARVAIIGSGFSGIAAAIALQRRGVEDFVLFEQADGLGGTWWKNRYPGAEVDLESHIYSFSFERADWTRTHAGWEEIRDYLHRVADKHGLLDKLRLNQQVEQVEWTEETSTYRVHTADGGDHGRFNAVISAVGFLNIPVVPRFARGDQRFDGTVCHTSEWPDDLDMTGKSVGVVGTGSSAVQVAPEAEKVASQIKVFQLEANWLLPKQARDFSARERWWNRLWPVYQARRRLLYLVYDLRQMLGGHAVAGKRSYTSRARVSERYLRESLSERPDLLERATPAHAFEGKRTVLSDTYYSMLKSPKVTLVPHAVTELVPSGVRDASGEEHDLDVVVLATGFDAANYLGNFRVTGDGGVDLHERWAGEPDAFLGMMVPGFPNFFIMYGPNTNSVPLVSFYEAQARFAARLIARMADAGKQRIDVRVSAFEAYNRWLQSRLARTVWFETSSYFRAGAGTGKIVSQWPYSASSYILATRLAERLAITIT